MPFINFGKFSTIVSSNIVAPFFWDSNYKQNILLNSVTYASYSFLCFHSFYLFILTLGISSYPISQFINCLFSFVSSPDKTHQLSFTDQLVYRKFPKFQWGSVAWLLVFCQNSQSYRYFFKYNYSLIISSYFLMLNSSHRYLKVWFWHMDCVFQIPFSGVLFCFSLFFSYSYYILKVVYIWNIYTHIPEWLTFL